MLDDEPFLPAGHRRSRRSGWPSTTRAAPGEAIAARVAALRLGRERAARSNHRLRARCWPRGRVAAGAALRARSSRRSAARPGPASLGIAARLEPEPERRGRAVPASAAVGARGRTASSKLPPSWAGGRTRSRRPRRRRSRRRVRDEAAGSALAAPAAEALGAPAASPWPAVPALSDGRVYGVMDAWARGLVSLRRERVEPQSVRDRAAAATRHATPSGTLTDEQAAAFEALKSMLSRAAVRGGAAARRDRSGKTEVYLRLARVVRAAGRTVLVLVPEIALTPARGRALPAAFGDRVAILHSGLSDGERYDQWQRIRRGDVTWSSGRARPSSRRSRARASSWSTRSTTPRSSRRRRRATTGGTWRWCAASRTARWSCSARPRRRSRASRTRERALRAAAARPPRPRSAAGRRAVGRHAGGVRRRGPDVILSEPLAEAIADAAGGREQVIVLLNRRGFATAVFCRQCAGTLECPNCSVSLTVHGVRGVHRARCHYCNYSAPCRRRARCAPAPYLERRASAPSAWRRRSRPPSRPRAWPASTATLGGRAPRPRCWRRSAAGRSTSSSARRCGQGPRFPGVTLVGVVSADVGLGLADFRAAERTFQLLTQVAGRAGRGEQTGKPSCRRSTRSTTASVTRAGRTTRRSSRTNGLPAGDALPPVVALASGRARAHAEAMADAADFVGRLQAGAAAGQYRVLGPAPAPSPAARGIPRPVLPERDQPGPDAPRAAGGARGAAVLPASRSMSTRSRCCSPQRRRGIARQRRAAWGGATSEEPGCGAPRELVPSHRSIG